MRIQSKTQTAMISLLCGVVFTASAAVAQTTSDTSTQTKSLDTGAKAMQAQKSASGMKSDDFLDGLKNLPTQSKADFNPSVGDTVPADMTLHPMPSAASEMLPGVKDHHVAKMAGKAVIADPKTRKITHVISTDSTASTTGGSTSDPSKAGKGGSTGLGDFLDSFGGKDTSGSSDVNSGADSK